MPTRPRGVQSSCCVKTADMNLILVVYVSKSFMKMHELFTVDSVLVRSLNHD